MIYPLLGYNVAKSPPTRDFQNVGMEIIRKYPRENHFRKLNKTYNSSPNELSQQRRCASFLASSFTKLRASTKKIGMSMAEMELTEETTK